MLMKKLATMLTAVLLVLGTVGCDDVGQDKKESMSPLTLLAVSGAIGPYTIDYGYMDSNDGKYQVIGQYTITNHTDTSKGFTVERFIIECNGHRTNEGPIRPLGVSAGDSVTWSRISGGSPGYWRNDLESLEVHITDDDTGKIKFDFTMERPEPCS
jgi:hypothetical protein